jgi:hypothetical protein
LIRDEAAGVYVHFLPTEVAGEPVALEHSEISWRTFTSLRALNLAPSDAVFVEKIIELATHRSGRSPREDDGRERGPPDVCREPQKQKQLAQFFDVT